MTNALLDTTVLVVEVGALFFAVTVAVQLFQARFGAERLRTWMGGRPLSAALKGIALGFITPFCTFTAVPMLVGLRQAKVPVAGYVAFIVAAPILDPVLFGALILIADLNTALIYAAIAFVAAIGLALAAEHAHIEHRLAPVEAILGITGDAGGAEGGDCDTACGSDAAEQWRGLRQELPSAARRATNLLAGMTPILLAGIALSVAIEVAVPPDVTHRLTSANPALSVPIAAALGTPLYVSTAVFVPLADALQTAGVGIGAIVALTIAGAGANLPEFVILSKLAQPRLIATFFASVFTVAMAGGFITQALLG